jgi:short-chain Z-isoprenyl diphosphate synthase
MTEDGQTLDAAARPRTEPVGVLIKRAAMAVLDLLAAPFYALYRLRLEAELPEWRKPQHIGIIMDGNRRFAKRRALLDILDGHAIGADRLEDVLNWCEEAGVRVVTVWIFSLDNFNRSAREVDGLMRLFEKKFLELVTHPRIHKNEIRVRTLGQTDRLPAAVQDAIHEAEQATGHYTRRILNVGVAYGGREEIVEAFRGYLKDRADQGLSPHQIAEELTPESIQPYLYTSHVPDPDLIIRTSGEVRMSGFLLWQSVYSEFYFCDTNWPAFRKIDFLRALRDYNRRQRRFGR